MNKLLIYTAGSGSREALLAVQELNEAKPTWEVLGFVDENPQLAGTKVDGFPVFGPDGTPHASDVWAICGVMDPKVRKRMSDQLIEGRGQRLATLIHPSVVVPKSFEAGPGTILMPGVRISFDVKLGKGVFILWNVLLGHGLRAGDWATVLSGTTITGGCSIGEMSTIGAGSTLGVGVHIGSNSLVGLGTTVLASVPDNKSVVALPRLIVREH